MEKRSCAWRKIGAHTERKRLNNAVHAPIIPFRPDPIVAISLISINIPSHFPTTPLYIDADF